MVCNGGEMCCSVGEGSVLFNGGVQFSVVFSRGSSVLFNRGGVQCGVN